MPIVQVDMELKNRMRQEREAKKALASHGHTDAARRDPSFEEIDAEIGQLTKSIQELLQAAQTQKTHRLSLSCDKVAQAVDRLTELFLPVGAHADRQTDPHNFTLIYDTCGYVFPVAIETKDSRDRQGCE